ncbi:Disease resistance protein L6 [Linum perenne]
MSKSESKSSPSFDPSPLPLPAGEYEVFLSFRGPDVRQTFADHLYTYLVASKIHTFRDEEELPKGEFLAPALEKAITESKAYIPIFSQNYASSKWCLQELANIVKCWKSGGGAKAQHVIFPVFYFIDPRDVRHPDSGSYKEAFEQHSLKNDPKTVLEWKNALQEVGKMKGWHITESDGQGAIIDKIFSKVDIHLRANYTLVTDELVGIDSHVENVVKLLNLDSASEKIVGIHGMGGLGKTTLAKAVYNKVSTQFEGCCFLDNIRDALSEKDGVLALQNKIISGILRKDSFKAKDVNDGIRVIRERVCKHKLLIVLDDVDERVQFEDILGKLENFSVDSRFIITTRDTRVLELLQECKLFELEEMSCDPSLKLFSKHAFGVNYPPEDYASLSTEFVRVATGLPLYLKVIGSLLFKRDKSFWKDKLIELKQIPPTEVQERLRISYNDLTHNQKQIFLDIACLFTEVYKEGPMHMWRDCDFHPTSAINTLVQRSLVKIGNDDAIWMHDHVRDLGRAIVREEHNQSPFKRSRMSYSKDAIDMLKYKEGTDSVEALRVDMKGENLVLRNEHLKELSRLRYLLLWNARLSGNFKDVLPNITKLKGEIEKLQNLQELDASNSSLIEVLAGISKLPSLERLNLLSDVSICVLLGLGELKLLEALNIERAPNLVNLDGLESLVLLKQLSLEGCTNLEKLPSLTALSSLELLQIESCPVITEIRGAGGLWESLSNLDVRGCSHLTDIGALHSMVNLESLVLIGIGLTKSVPSSLSMFKKLRELTVSEFSLEQFPDLSNLKNLRELWITECNKLIEVTGLDTLESLELLSMYGSGSIKKLPDLSRLVKLKKLYVTGCTKLIEIRGLEKLELLEDLDMSSCKSIKELPNLSGLKILNKLVLRKCRQLKEVKGIEDLEFLQVFEADKRLEFKYLLKRVSRYGKHFVTRSVPGALCMGN